MLKKQRGFQIMKSPSVNYKDNLILHGKVFHADDRCGDYLFFQPIPKIGMSNFYKSINAIHGTMFECVSPSWSIYVERRHIKLLPPFALIEPY